MESHTCKNSRGVGWQFHVKISTPLFSVIYGVPGQRTTRWGVAPMTKGSRSALAHTSPARPALGGVRVLVFDLDGTLIDSETDLANSVNATLGLHGACAVGTPQIASYVGQGARRLIEQALGHGATAEECQLGLEYFLAYYRAHMLDHTVTYPGVREGLAALEGMPMAVLTNKPVRFSRADRRGTGPGTVFSLHLRRQQLRDEETRPCRHAGAPARFGRTPSKPCSWAIPTWTCRQRGMPAPGPAA